MGCDTDEKPDRKGDLTDSEKAQYIEKITGLVLHLSDVGCNLYRGANQFQPQIRDDLVAAAYLGAAMAADIYKKSCGVSEATFAYRFIWKQILHQMKFMSSLGFTPLGVSKEQRRPGTVQLDGLPVSGDREHHDDYSCGEHGIELALDLIDDDRDRDIVRMRIVDGMTFTEIGKRFGIIKQRAGQLFDATIKRISPRVKELIADGKL